eukprot:TRINITY_DN2652_c0_g1_i8.p1 TRINITY_DN2652_c0_g1~~TRINITY_DN2652_c0_g1_i8.p1  ORF type:complete len:103 (+),score=25.83 TRINITY_DN2652_c0_g1_i8:69-377(+)
MYQASPSLGWLPESRTSSPSAVCLILSLLSCMDRSLVCRNRKKVVERDSRARNSLHLFGTYCLITALSVNAMEDEEKGLNFDLRLEYCKISHFFWSLFGFLR